MTIIKMIRLLTLLGILLFSNTYGNQNYSAKEASAEKNTYNISKIIIEGNKVTKDLTILREILISKNQSISLEELEISISESKKNLTNTL
jgi:outer membrane protein assembly factor BamA